MHRTSSTLVLLLLLLLTPAVQPPLAAQEQHRQPGRPTLTGTFGSSRSRGGSAVPIRDARMADATLTWRIRSASAAHLVTGVTIAVTRNDAYNRNCDDPVTRTCDVYPPLNFLGIPVGVDIMPHRRLSLAPYLIPGIFAGDNLEPGLGAQARVDATAALGRQLGAVVSGRAAGFRSDGEQVSIVGLTFGLRIRF